MKKVEILPNKRKRVMTINKEPSRTQQQFKDQVNVNKIMAKYKKTGTISHLRNASQGVYADLTELPDYMESLMVVKSAQSAFEQLPAVLRERFQHDPSQLISYLADSKNHDEAVKLGLMVKRELKNEPNERPSANPPPTADKP